MYFSQVIFYILKMPISSRLEIDIVAKVSNSTSTCTLFELAFRTLGRVRQYPN
jgi:hypothetical protein